MRGTHPLPAVFFHLAKSEHLFYYERVKSRFVAGLA
jgi:hypothetical protein